MNKERFQLILGLNELKLRRGDFTFGVPSSVEITEK